jgi:hypothetical protein
LRKSKEPDSFHKEDIAMKSGTKYYVVAVFTMLLGFIGQTASPLAPIASAASQQQNVIEISTFGATYGEWTARWWQWALSIPEAVNPILDTTGENCAQDQVDDVWFLAGTFSDDPVTRVCTIPAEKSIFFPLINRVALLPFGNETLLDLRRLAGDFIDTVTFLEATIDDKKVQDLFSFRVRSPSFTVIAPPDGVLPPGQTKVPGNTDPLVSDGFWLLLSALSKGSHVIHFRAETSDGSMQDVTYTLSIE